MKLSISNIAWVNEFDKEIYQTLFQNQFEGIEIAPTRIIPENPYKNILTAKKISKELSKKYLTTLVLSLLFIMINPQGIKMIFYPYQNMTYKVMLSCIDEWQRLNIFSIDGIFYLLFIISIIYILFKNIIWTYFF
jgi:hypothetical protein